ncbi:MAG: Arc family DNA-binding protein [Clostridiales bacterium]|nr:Arc family DNA-binding protein [Clostridiales bacterium]
MVKKSFSIRLDSEMLEKISRIAAYEGRSLNRQILVVINQCIKRYESCLPCEDKQPPNVTTKEK